VKQLSQFETHGKAKEAVFKVSLFSAGCCANNPIVDIFCLADSLCVKERIDIIQKQYKIRLLD